MTNMYTDNRKFFDGIELSDQLIVAMSAGGFIFSRLLMMARSLNLFDFLQKGRDLNEISDFYKLHTPTLERFLNAFESCGIISKDGAGKYIKNQLTKKLDLITDSFSGIMAYKAWEESLFTLKTGKPAWDNVHGGSFYQTLSDKSELSSDFYDWHIQTIDSWLAPLIKKTDYSKFTSICDLGGGDGYYLSLILRENNHLMGSLFDRESAVKDFPRHVEFFGLQNKIMSVNHGDLLTDPLPEGDAYSICRVLLNLSDEHVLCLLKKLRKQSTLKTRIFITDIILNPTKSLDNSFSFFNDLNLLVLMGGKMRTLENWKELFCKSNFAIEEIIEEPSVTHFSVLKIIPC